MFKTTGVYLVFLIVIGEISSFRLVWNNLNDEWKHFLNKHNKFYNSHEELMRRKIYFDNKKAIDSHNKQYRNGQSKFYMGMNQFGDLALEEFLILMTGLMGYKQLQPPTIPPSDYEFYKNISKDVPNSIDWRNYNIVTPVKNQGQCGSCWAFSATGSLEGQHAIKTGDLVSLSEQNLVDCDHNHVNNGCNGGNMDNAFTYVTLNDGIDTEESYPYTGHNGPCQFSNNTVGSTANGYRNLPSGDEDTLKAVVGVIGPVSVGIDAKGLLFQFYKQGIYYNPFCSSTRLNHGVLVVGYGTTDDNEDYWIVKNSWGPQWGDNGYIYMSRNKNNNCGIASAASYPIVE
ncbi:hypothetical protein CHUAL_013601 [Chamberlinius hualienensis]